MLGEVKRFHAHARRLHRARRRRRRATTSTASPWARSSPSAATPLLRPALHDPGRVRASGPPAPAPRWSTRPPTCSGSWTTTGCSRSPAPRSGGRSPAAPGRYVEKAAKGLSGVQTGTGIRALTRHADGVELIDDDGQRHACGRRRRRHPPRPGAAAARRPDRRRAGGARRVRPTRATRPCCTPTPGCCRPPAGPGRRGTTG